RRGLADHGARSAGRRPAGRYGEPQHHARAGPPRRVPLPAGIRRGRDQGDRPARARAVAPAAVAVSVLFPYYPAVEPESPVIERIGFDTEILVAKNRKEQRIKLRAYPTGAAEFGVLELKAEDSTAMLGLL